MSKNTLENTGLDIGYNETKLWNKLRQVSFASVTGTPEESSFGYGDDAGSIILTHPVHVAVGAHAIDQSASLDGRIDRNWLESDKWTTLALAAFSEAIKISGSLQLVCGLPIAYFDDKDRVVERLLGQHTLQRKDRNQQTITVEKCSVMPQGFGVLFSECLTDSGTISDKILAAARVGIIDIGGKTTNFLVANKVKMVDKVSGSIEAGGWDVVSRVMTHLANEYSDLNLSEYELIEHIQSKTVNYHGQAIDLAEVVDDATQTLAKRVIGQARRLWNGAARLDTILVAGGGAHLVGQALLAEFPQARIVDSDPVFSNARGYWRYRQALTLAGK